MQADGQVHGAFTWALLKGLRSAVDDAGAITSHSLKGYLVNAMATFMTDEQRRDERVSNEPDFGSEDDILFADAARTAIDVTVHLPPAGVGRRYQIVTGSPPYKARSGIVRFSPTFKVPLSNGLYVITVPVAKLTGQIEVIGVAREINLA